MARGPGPTTGDALPTVTRLQRKRLLEDLLRGVSRSFYLTLRVLPGNLRQPVGLAYFVSPGRPTPSPIPGLSPRANAGSFCWFSGSR